VKSGAFSPTSGVAARAEIGIMYKAQNNSTADSEDVLRRLLKSAQKIVVITASTLPVSYLSQPRVSDYRTRMMDQELNGNWHPPHANSRSGLDRNNILSHHKYSVDASGNARIKNGSSP